MKGGDESGQQNDDEGTTGRVVASRHNYNRQMESAGDARNQVRLGCTVQPRRSTGMAKDQKGECLMNDLIKINNVRGFIDEAGVAQLSLDDVCRGLGFTQEKNGALYVRWDRVKGYLEDMGFPHLMGKEFIPENVFYRLSMKGETEAAKAFQSLVADEILPAIRKTGSYSGKLPQTFGEALRQLAATWEYNQTLITRLDEAKPKVDFFNAVADSKDAVPMNEVSKVLAIKGMGRNNLFEFLRNQKVLMGDNQPYQKFIDCGYFRTIEQKYTDRQGEAHISFKTLVYQKGLDHIRRLVNF